MKIEKIILCNLTSLEGEQIIDFTVEPLRSAGLFAITGDTGAGKSTLLDAICLALYDRAPRFDGVERLETDAKERLVQGKVRAIQTDDVRNLLRRGCSEAYSRVAFTARDGRRYEAEWRLRVNRNGNVEPAQRQLRRLAPQPEEFGGTKTEINRQIEEITGLTYEQFTRTALLAQNSFSNFLKARRSEKSGLLEKLTGTEIYGEISRRIYDRTRAAASVCDSLRERLRTVAGSGLLDEADYAQTVEGRRLAQASLDHALSDVERLTAYGRWFAAYDGALADQARCEAQYTAAHKAYVARRDDEAALERYDRVQPMHELYQHVLTCAAQIERNKAAAAELDAQIGRQKEVVRQAAEEQQRAHEAVATAESRLAVRRPELDEGYRLQGQLDDVNEQLRHLAVRCDQRRNLLNNTRDGYKNKGAEYDSLMQRLAKNRADLQSLVVHRRMLERYDLVCDKLNQLNRAHAETRRLGELLEGSRRQRAELAATVDTERDACEQVEQQIRSKREALDMAGRANQGRDGLELQTRLATLQRDAARLESARALWNRITTGYADVERLQADVERAERELKQVQQTVSMQEEALVPLRREHARLLEACTLSRSKDIEGLRHNLREGTPCPLCGATHHPYHTETEQKLGHILSKLEQDFTEVDGELTAKVEKLEALKSEQTRREVALSAGRDYLSRRREQQDADVSEWGTYAALDRTFADCSASVNREARRLMLGQLLDNTQRSLAEVQRAWTAFNANQQAINQLNADLRRLSEEAVTMRERFERQRRELAALDQTIAQTQQRIAEADNASGQLYNELDKSMTLSAWYATWSHDPDHFHVIIEGYYKKWCELTVAIEQGDRESAVLSEQLAAIGRDVTLAENALREAEAEQARTAERREALTAGLKRLFGESSPRAEAEVLQRDVDTAVAREQQLRRDCDAARAVLDNLTGRCKNLAESDAAVKAEWQQHNSRLDSAILRFNGRGEGSPLQRAELERIFADERHWYDLRAELNRIREARILASDRLEQARTAVTRLMGEPGHPSGQGDEAPEAVAAALPAARRSVEEQRQQLAMFDRKLQIHEERREQVEGLQKELDEAVAASENWTRLNAMFGSADGKRFRELAQSYTFRFLVEHANRQLRLFSPRYRLQTIPGTLDLEIIDRDMFDRRRYVYSLSGGETFIVSLALALGLASLSAGSLQIGSLFIDEGFGNLDQASLELVMDALSHLESTQGRKVGVISHTEQIRSQISPQIHIVKLPTGGRSRIEIS